MVLSPSTYTVFLMLALSVAIYVFRVSATKRPCPYCQKIKPKYKETCGHCRRIASSRY